jgi:galactokinase
MVAEELGDAGGARLTGAGFGGCLVAVTANDALPAIQAAVARYNTDVDLPACAETYRAASGAAPIVLE